MRLLDNSHWAGNRLLDIQICSEFVMTIIDGVIVLLIFMLFLSVFFIGLRIKKLETRQRWHKLEAERLNHNQEARKSSGIVERPRAYKDEYWYG